MNDSAKSATRELRQELLQHPPYLSDLAFDDYHFFKILKQFVRGKRFLLNEDSISMVEQYFAELLVNYHRYVVKLLHDHWNKCNEVERDRID